MVYPVLLPIHLLGTVGTCSSSRLTRRPKGDISTLGGQAIMIITNIVQFHFKSAIGVMSRRVVQLLHHHNVFFASLGLGLALVVYL